MKISPTLDRAALVFLRFVALINIVFLAAFLATLVLATGKARAEPSCTGIDLLAELEREDAALHASIFAEADEAENGDSNFWSIKPLGGGEVSWLFGTMHVTDPRVVALPAGVDKALGAAATVVIETTDVLDPAAMLSTIMRDPELTQFTDDTTLRSLIPPEDLPMVEAALRSRGIPIVTIDKMKPWMLSAMVAMPACETARVKAGEPILDIALARRAQAAGQRLVGLESIGEQLGAMASLPMDLHIEGLVETLRLGERMDDIMETMVAIYLSGRPGLFWPFFRAALPAGEEGASAYAAFEEAMVTARNRTMAERAALLIEDGGAFIAVGALHLPGPEGLVALLKARGYEVEPLPR